MKNKELKLRTSESLRDKSGLGANCKHVNVTEEATRGQWPYNTCVDKGYEK